MLLLQALCTCFLLCRDRSSQIFLHSSPLSVLFLNITFPVKIPQFLHLRLYPQSTPVLPNPFPALFVSPYYAVSSMKAEMREFCFLMCLQFLKHFLVHGGSLSIHAWFRPGPLWTAFVAGIGANPRPLLRAPHPQRRCKHLPQL